MTASGDAVDHRGPPRPAHIGVDPKATSYLYDADGGLLIQRGPSGTVLYLFGGTEQLTLNSTGTTVSGLRYYSNPDGTAITRSSAGTLTYQPTNPQHTAQLQVDATSLAITRRSYDPYGQPRGTTPTSWADNHGYLGQPADPTTGLDLLGARDYDPVLGRFLTVDPVFEAGDPSQMGGYAYAGDDPVDGSDPSGLMFRAGDSNVTVKDQAKTQAYTCEQSGSSIAQCENNTPYEVNHGWRHALDVGTSLVQLIGAGIVVDAGVEALGVCSATVVVAPECVAAGRVAAGALSSVVGGCVDTGCTDGAGGITEEPTVHVSDDPPAASAKTQHDLASGNTLEEAAPAPPGNPEAGTPAEAARPSSPKSATARKPVADDTNTAEQAPASSGSRCSFSPDTPVLLDHGKTKPIGDVTVGDKVESADPKTGKHAGPHTVTATWVNYDTDLVDVTIQGADGKPATVHTTSNHPFWDDTTHKWVPAAKLTPGHALNTDKNLHATVLAVRITPGAANRYNLTVAQLHTYYVLAGATPVLVHNTCGDSVVLGVGEHSDSLAASRRAAGDAKAHTFNDGNYGDVSENGLPGWMNGVQEAVGNSNTRLTVSLDGLPGATPAEAFANAYARGVQGGMKMATQSGYGTAWEMSVVGRNIMLGNRSWDSINWYWNGLPATMHVPDFTALRKAAGIR
jgi:RHS repeat-associated protein